MKGGDTETLQSRIRCPVLPLSVRETPQNGGLLRRALEKLKIFKKEPIYLLETAVKCLSQVSSK